MKYLGPALALAWVGLVLLALTGWSGFQPPPPTPTPTTPTPIVVVPWEVNCDDDILENGYMVQGVCVPGRPTWDASRFENPGLFGGAMSSYGPGVMEGVCAYRRFGCNNGAVAVMGCGDLGKKAYIDRLDGTGWQGPFTIADCSGRNHVYYNIMVNHLAVEIDYATAQKWGTRAIGYVNVKIPANGGDVLTDRIPPLWEWYAANAMAFDWFPFMVPPTATPSETPRPTDTPRPTLAPSSTAAPVLIQAVVPKEDTVNFDSFVVAGIPLILVVFALVEEVKLLGLEGRILRLVSMLIGVALALAFQLTTAIPATAADWFRLIVVGIVFGLTASGGYDFLKDRMPKRLPA